MEALENPPMEIDWILTTWEGSRQETMRRWAELPLERIVAALEEMEELVDALGESTDECRGQFTRDKPG